ncbi:MAG: hypothetical protein OXI26_10205 [bacterium]|nr:hypothetical protein [bacterium]
MKQRLLFALLPLTVLGILLPAASVGSHEPDVTVRIVARKLADGRVEFGLRQQQADGTYGSEILPRIRFFPTTAQVGRWLRSSPVDLSAGTSASSSATTTQATYTHSHCQRVRNDGGCDRRFNPPFCATHSHPVSERSRHDPTHC